MSQGRFTFARDLEIAPRRVADTSIVAYERLKPLTPLNLGWLLRVYAYLWATGHEDVSGAELAEFFDVDKTTTRPRLTGCFECVWLTKGEIRPSRLANEGLVRGYRPVLPRRAVERAQERQQ